VSNAPAGTADTNSATSRLPQASFDDLYSATYAILDDAKTDHDLVKLSRAVTAHPTRIPS
jgi:hypothetical protein